MIKSKLFLVADRVIRDSETNNISIIDIIDDITAESYPILIQRLAIIAFVEKEDENEPTDNPSLRFKLTNNANEIGNHLIKIDFRGRKKTRAIINLGSIPISEPGVLSFVLEDVQGAEIDNYSILLKLRNEIIVKS